MISRYHTQQRIAYYAFFLCVVHWNSGAGLLGSLNVFSQPSWCKALTKYKCDSSKRGLRNQHVRDRNVQSSFHVKPRTNIQIVTDMWYIYISKVLINPIWKFQSSIVLRPNIMCIPFGLQTLATHAYGNPYVCIWNRTCRFFFIASHNAGSWKTMLKLPKIFQSPENHHYLYWFV